MPNSSRRFRVAISYAGVHRSFVEEIVKALSNRLKKEAIFFDRNHQAENARARLGLELSTLYHDDSDLVVVIACPKYNKTKWTRLEWSAIHSLLNDRKHSKRVMLCRFGKAEVEGIYSAGYAELNSREPEEAARLILERLASNEGKDKNDYINMTSITTTGSKRAVRKSSGVRIVVPVGPCPFDIEKMPSVQGVKPLAKLRRKEILFHLLERWDQHANLIEKVSFILNDVGLEKGDDRKSKCDDFRSLLKKAGKQFSNFTDKLEIIEGLKDEFPTETLCKAAKSKAFPSRFLLHYCDVWPSLNNDLYASLFEYAHPQSKRPMRDGVLACATKTPRDLFSSSSKLPPNHGDIVANVLGLVAKPFHVIEIDALVKGSSNHGIHVRYANMAIAVLTKEFIASINSTEEMFHIIGKQLRDGGFSAHIFTGEWNHCDTDHDVSIIDTIGLV